jgi:hypothetical protein
MRRLVSAAALLIAATASAQPADPLAPLQFLVGSWRALDTPPGERGAFTFTFDVQQHVLVRTNEAVYDATASHPASRHDDLMIVYAENGAMKADYFDNEGHVIRYRAHAEPNRVVFVSDPDPQGPRYRLTYTLGTDRVLTGSFEIAMPAAPDAFTPYLSWKAQK